MIRRCWLIVIAATVLLLSSLHVEAGYNIALHAQVAPDQGKIVGSVITTNGLKAALKKRLDVDTVQIFYPTQHKGFFDTNWDVLIIEGWFLSLAEFVQVTRNQFPNIVIIFYALDPTYPSLEEILQFDVDGIMTNSKKLYEICQSKGIASAFVMLAADPEVMQANFSTTKAWDAVYVGAGGFMLEQKPRLRQMLVDVHPFKLRLHGTGWERVPVLSELSLGPLPQHDLDDAYNSAEVVLAYTIESQDIFGMINNRMFEALSTGAVVMCEESATLRETFGDLLFYYNDQASIHSLIRQLKYDNNFAQLQRLRAREFILSRHTWDHRVVEVMNFATHLLSAKTFMETSSLQSLRTNVPKMMWVPSNHLLDHIDYTMMVERHIQRNFRRSFQVEEWTEDQFHASYSEHCSLNTSSTPCRQWLRQYDSIFAIVNPYDDLDQSMRSLPFDVVVRGKVQRRAAYILGIDDQKIDQYCSHLENNCKMYTHYDGVFYRSEYEINYLTTQLKFNIPKNRLTHCYGIGQYLDAESVTEEDSHLGQVTQQITSAQLINHRFVNNTEIPVCICFSQHMALCNRATRLRALGSIGFPQSAHALILLGGHWETWLKYPEIVHSTELHNTIHVRDGSYHDDLLLLMSKANFSLIFTGGSKGDKQQTDGSSTSTDVLYPLIGAMVYNSKIHISVLNSHYIALASGNHGFDVNYVDVMVKVGMDQMFGMPAIQAKIKFEVLEFVVDKDIINCLNCIPRDSALINSGYLLHLFANQSNPFLVLRMQHEHFTTGRDGHFCVNHIHGTLDNMICMIRTMNHLIIKQDGEEFDNQNLLIFELSFSLRGNFYGNIAYFSNHTILHSTKILRKPVLDTNKQFNKAIFDDLYEYSYPFIV